MDKSCANHPESMALATCKACDKSVCLMCVVDEKEGTFCSSECHTAFASGREVPKFIGVATESASGSPGMKKLESIFDDKSKRHRVTGREDDPRPELGGAGFPDRGCDHFIAEIDADDGPRACPSEFERQLAGAGSDIERERRSWFSHRNRDAAPSAIEPERHQRIDEVIMRHDGREHVADSRCFAAVWSLVHRASAFSLDRRRLVIHSA